jgi:hypothetical protein
MGHARQVGVLGVLVAAAITMACFLGSSDSRPEVVKRAAEKTPVATAQATMDSERAAYLSKVDIRRVSVKPGLMGLQEKPGAVVDLEVKNTGERSLDEVQITIYFLDKKGGRVYEHQSYPVLVGTILHDEGPLKPNYARAYSGGCEDVPSDWGGKVEVRVTDVKFTAAK